MGEPTRVEVFFQYVQHKDLPLAFDELSVPDVTLNMAEMGARKALGVC